MTLRRSGPPERRARLVARTELSRTSGLSSVEPPQRRAPMPGSATPSNAPNEPQRRPGGGKARPARDIPHLTRLAVYERDGGKCARCARELWEGNRSIQHRAGRGMGSGNPRPHAMSNLVAVCGLLSTLPDYCQHRIESRPIEAQASGFRVPMGQEPADWPIHYHDGWWLLTDDGLRVPAAS